MSETNHLTVSSSPHIKGSSTVSGIMLDVIIALIPAVFAGVAVFGLKAAVIIAVCIISCVVFEAVSRKIMKRRNTIRDLSAVVTGLLLAFNLPVDTPWWICVVGSLVAIVVVKQFFGGIGQNFANPAITARIVLLVSFAKVMTSFSLPSAFSVDAVAGATPLAQLSAINLDGNITLQLKQLISDGELPSLLHMFFGVRQGCIGECCSVALLLGVIYLLVRGVIKLSIPLAFTGTVAVFMFIASDFNIYYTAYELLGGGLLLGAFFMATDYTTSPINKKGKIVFGIGCGLLTCIIRLYCSAPEGVSYAILLMNIATPLIEKLTAPRYFGFVKTKKVKEAKAE